jgi:hypothetical protein
VREERRSPNVETSVHRAELERTIEPQFGWVSHCLSERIREFLKLGKLLGTRPRHSKLFATQWAMLHRLAWIKGWKLQFLVLPWVANVSSLICTVSVDFGTASVGIHSYKYPTNSWFLLEEATQEGYKHMWLMLKVTTPNGTSTDLYIDPTASQFGSPKAIVSWHDENPNPGIPHD